MALLTINLPAWIDAVITYQVSRRKRYLKLKKEVFFTKEWNIAQIAIFKRWFDRFLMIEFQVFLFQRFLTFINKLRPMPREIFHWPLVSEKRIKAWAEVFLCFLNSFYTLLIRNMLTFQFEVYSRKIETNGQSTSR